MMRAKKFDKANYQRLVIVGVLLVIMLALTVLYLINVLWLIPVFSRFSNRLGKIVQLNYVIAVRHILRGVLMLLCAAAAVLLIKVSPPLAVLLPSLAMLGVSYLAEPGLHRFMPKQTEDNGDWRYGFK